MWTRLVNECLDRTGRRVMLVSVALGVLVGLSLAQIVRLTPDLLSNLGIWVLIGGAFAFFVDLVFISPIRLWREAEMALATAREEIRALRNAPPNGMQIGHIGTQVNVQLSAGGILNVSASSNTAIVGLEQEGVLFPRGTIFRNTLDGLSTIDDAVAAVTSSGIAFVPPELLDTPPGPDQSSTNPAISSQVQT